MQALKYKILVLGLGNVLRSDDGVGVYVLEMLRRQKWPPGVALFEVGIGVLNFVGEISCARNVIAVDAVLAGGKPGTIYRLAGTDLVPAQGLRDAHAFSLPQAVKMAGNMTGFPSGLVIFGVEPENMNLGASLSPAVRAAVPEVVRAVAKEVERLVLCPGVKAN